MKRITVRKRKVSNKPRYVLEWRWPTKRKWYIAKWLPDDEPCARMELQAHLERQAASTQPGVVWRLVRVVSECPHCGKEMP